MRHERVLLIILLLGMTFAVFWQVGGHPFISLDDRAYVDQNPVVLDGLTPRGVIWAFTSFELSNWHPLTWASHMVDAGLFGTDAGWHHRVNLLFHALNVVLLFLVMNAMTGAPRPSAFVAALFAIHPMHVESVAWVAERKDLLSTLFLLLTVGAYVRYVRKPAIGRYAAVVALFALGLLSKPMLVTLPFLLLLLDLWPLGRTGTGAGSPGEGSMAVLSPAGWGRLVREKIPLFALSALSSAVTYAAQAKGGSVAAAGAIPVALRASNALASYASYVGKAFWPVELSIFYPFPHGGLPAWKIAGSTGLLVLVTAAALLQRRGRPWLAVGWLWFLGTLVPVIGLVQVGGQAMADRYSYVPFIGLFIMVAWGVPELVGDRPWRGRVLGAAAAAGILALGATAWSQTSLWRSDETLFRHALGVRPDNGMAWNGLGLASADQGRHAEAVGYFRRALQVRPDDAAAWRNLGISYVRLGQPVMAVEAFETAVRLRPNFVDAWKQLGVANGTLGRRRNAVEAFGKAVSLRPGDAVAWNDLGNAYDDFGQPARAIASYREALRLDPDLVLAWQNLGITYAALGDRDKVLDVHANLRRIDAAKAAEFLLTVGAAK